MSNSGAVVLDNIWHLVCSTEGPFKAYCGRDLYTSGRPSLFVGSPYGAANCETCTTKDKENDEAALAAHVVMVKGLSNRELLEEVYGTIGALNSDTCSAKEYDDNEQELIIEQAELNARLTACGFLPPEK